MALVCPQGRSCASILGHNYVLQMYDLKKTKLSYYTAKVKIDLFAGLHKIRYKTFCPGLSTSCFLTTHLRITHSAVLLLLSEFLVRRTYEYLYFFPMIVQTTELCYIRREIETNWIPLTLTKSLVS